MPTTFYADHDGRRIELVPESSLHGDRVHLLIDGEHVAEARSQGRDTVVESEGLVVRAVVPWHGMSIASAELLRDGSAPLALEPAPGSRAARRAQLRRENPGVFAARRFATGVGVALLALAGVALLVTFLPAIPWPSIDVPELPLPSLDVPGWLKAILLTKAIWLPLLLSLALALGEWSKRRARGRRARERQAEPTQPS